MEGNALVVVEKRMADTAINDGSRDPRYVMNGDYNKLSLRLSVAELGMDFYVAGESCWSKTDATGNLGVV